MRTLSLLTMVGFALMGAQAPAPAQESYPSRPVHIVVPYPAGGGQDSVARVLGAKLSTALGQPIVIDNKPGAGENIATSAVVRSAADGYTLLFSSGSLTINPLLFKNLNYNAAKDLTPIGKVANLPLLLVCAPSAPFKTLAELIAYAKAHPDALAYGTPGVGTPHHLAMELMKSEAGVQIRHVPYVGTAPGLTNLLGGTLELLTTTIAPSKAYLDSGEVRILATFDRTKLDRFGGVAPASDLLPGFAVEIWLGLFAPSALPSGVSETLVGKLKTIVLDDDFAAQMSPLGVTPNWSAPADLSREMVDERSLWAQAIKAADLKPE